MPMLKLRGIVVSATLFQIIPFHYAQMIAVAQTPTAETRLDDRATTRQENSADRLLFWTRATEVAALSDAELDLWKGRGVGGFICMTRHLKGMGGTDDFTADRLADLDAARYATQRSLRDSQVGRRAKERGLKMYLGCYIVDYYNTATPFKDWFDDAGWENVVIPRVRDFAAAARCYGKRLRDVGIHDAIDAGSLPKLSNGTRRIGWGIVV